MDILNFISWIASKRRIVNSLTYSDLIPVGVRNETRDDKYTTVAITAKDFFAQIPAPVPEPVIDSEGNLIVADSSNDIVQVALGESHTIPNFSGMLLVNDHYGGRVELWLAGGGDPTTLVSYSLMGSPAYPDGQTNTLVISGQGYVWTNKDNFGQSGTGITFTVIKTRQGS